MVKSQTCVLQANTVRLAQNKHCNCTTQDHLMQCFHLKCWGLYHYY